MKKVKIVIGANYGDEGKGLMTRHFVTKNFDPYKNTIVIFHNGTAQRGHTVDYNKELRHVYHHFNSGTIDGAITFFADTFYLHPMAFHKEYDELIKIGANPKCICDPNAKVITPFDTVIDCATEDYIAKEHDEREFGSCGYGSWCAIEDRYPMNLTAYTIRDFILPVIENKMNYIYDHMMEEIWKDCISILIKRGIDINNTKYKYLVGDRTAIKNNFKNDLLFMISHMHFSSFNTVWENKHTETIIFENGQGLGLDKDIDNEWHTTSKTGLYNPFHMLKDKKDFQAEVCYVSRSYLTRHGVGPLESYVKKENINSNMEDKTNVPNEFQGGLRYGYYDYNEQQKRIRKDWQIVDPDLRFYKTEAITHCNEFDCGEKTVYMSYDPYTVKEFM